MRGWREGRTRRWSEGRDKKVKIQKCKEERVKRMREKNEHARTRDSPGLGMIVRESKEGEDGRLCLECGTMEVGCGSESGRKRRKYHEK